MQGEFCQKLPPWVYGGVQLEGASLLYIRLEIISVRREEFRRLRAASDFPSDGKVTKGSPGDAADGHFVPIGPLTPGSPFTGAIPWSGQSISSAQNLSDTLNSRRATGPWVCKNCIRCGPNSAPGFAEQVIVGLLSACRPVSGPYEKEGPASRSAVGAAHWAARRPPAILW